MLLVHNEIHYVPIGDSWEEVMVRNVLHYVPILLSTFLGPNGTRFARAISGSKNVSIGPTPSNAPRNDVAPLKIISYQYFFPTITYRYIMYFIMYQ